MKPIRVGLVGFGRVGERHHLKNMRKCGMYDVRIAYDITEARLEKARELDLIATTDFDEFLAADTELVVICTPSSLHTDFAIKAAEAGKHILCEKPIAQTAAEAHAMAEAALSRGLVFTVNQNDHMEHGYRLVKHAVRSGILGELVRVENRNIGQGPSTGYGCEEYNREWRITKAMGGGTLMDYGAHRIEQMLDLMSRDKVVQVFGDVRHILWGDADDLFQAEFIFESGIRGVSAKWDLPWHRPLYSWLIVGTEGTLYGPIKEEDRQCVVFADKDQKEHHLYDTWPDESIHENLARHIREDEELIITPEHALRVMDLIQATRDSAEAGRSVDVEV